MGISVGARFIVPAFSSCPIYCVRAAIREEALGKRAAGSLAIQRMMIVVSSGGRPGLINVGKVGTVLICCIMIVAGLFPGNGGVPTLIS